MQEEAAICALLDRAAGGLLLLGAPGAGKTRLVGEAADLARARGWQVEWRPVPVGLSGPRDVIGALPRASADRKTILCIDDAHRLNHESAASVFTAVTSGRAVAVASLLEHAGTPQSLFSLWKDGVCARQVIAPLDRADADSLAQELVGGIVDGITLARFWRLAHGTPLYLRELIAGGLAGGELVHKLNVWQWQGEMLPTERLVQLVENQIGTRPTKVRDALDLVAVGEPVSPDVLMRAGADPAALEVLEQDDLIEVRRAGRRTLIRTRHPMIAAALRASTGLLRSRGLHRRLADGWREFGGRADDVLRLGTAMNASGELDCAATAERLSGAASRAGAYGKLVQRERSARAALEADGSVLAAAQLGEALSWLERHEEAEGILASYAPRAGTDSERVAIGGRRAAILRWGLDRPNDAWKVLDSLEAGLADPASWPGVTALRQRFLALDGAITSHESERDARAGVRNERTNADFDPDQWRSVLGSSPVCRVFDLVSRGRFSEAVGCWEEGDCDADTQLADTDPLHREQLAYGLCLAHLAAGNLAAASRIADASYLRNTDRQWWLCAALWASCLGEIAHARGRPRESLRWMQEAAATASAAPPHPYALLIEHVGLAGVARAAAMLGDVVAAEDVLATRAGLAPVPEALIRHWPADHLPWLEIARGQPAQAVEAALATAASYAQQEMTGFQVAALHLAARLGGSMLAAEALPEPADDPTAGGDMHDLAILHIHALASSDPYQLDAVSQKFAELGAMLLAAESAGAASLTYSRSNDTERALALAASSRARRWAAACEGVNSPVLNRMLESSALTRRQREIAQFAMTGLSSREIAARLFVSVRTVDNALGAVYRKLGVRNRQELTAFLEPFDVREIAG